MKRPLLIFILLSCILAGFGQSSNEANMWVFGRRAGLNFNFPTGPQPNMEVADDFIYAQEGCASIASSSGELLFYTDGQTIWNKNHVHMEGGEGLLGHYSSTQSGIIVPKPEDPNTYYVFTVPYMGDPVGLKYSVVDITQNGGLGKVVEKNKPLERGAPVTEKVTAMKHANNEDIWVITHKWQTYKIIGEDTIFNPSDSILSYLVTAQGVNTAPIVSEVGRECGGNPLNTVGYMKGSPSGDKLAMAVFFSDYYQLFDFDPYTGKVTNPITFEGFKGAYGLEFSPNSRYLYLSAQDTIESNKMHIYQYDLFAGDSMGIINSKFYVGYTMADPGYAGRGALQVGPDQKIYIARAFLPYLAIINNPNLGEASCDLDPEGIWLGSSSYRTSMYGLPTFIQTYFAPPDFDYTNICWGDTTEFTITSDITGFQSVHWDFGDGGVSDQLSPKHKFADWGTHIVTLVISYISTDRTAQEQIMILPKPTASFTYDPYCFGAPTHFHDQSNPNGGTVDGWIWDFGDGGTSIEKNPPHTFATQGQHNVKLTVTTNNGCISDPVTLPVNQIPPPAVSPAPTGLTKMCENSPNSSYNTTGAPDAVSYIWSLTPATAGTTNGSTTKNVTVNWNDTFSGTATIKVTSVNQCNENSAPSGALQVNVTALPIINIQDTVIIPYDTQHTIDEFTITGTGPFSYNWEPVDKLMPGENTKEHPITISLLLGVQFTLTVTDINNCVASADIYIDLSGAPLSVTAEAVKDSTSICIYNQTQLKAVRSGGEGPFTFEWTCDPNPNGWSSMIDDPVVQPEESTTYTVIVKDKYFHEASSSILITVYDLPIADAGEDQIIPYGTSTTLFGTASGGAGSPYHYFWTPEVLLSTPNTIPNPSTVPLFSGVTFNLQIKDGLNCVRNDYVFISYTGGPLSVEPQAIPDTICKGDITTLHANPAGGGSSNYTFQWDPPELLVDPTKPITSTKILTGNTTFNVKVKEGLLETDGQVTITVNPLPETLLYPGSVPYVDDPVKVCVYDTLVLHPYQGTEEVTYWWSNGSNADSMQVQTTGVGVEIQTYWVRTEFVKTGCVNHDTVTFIFTFEDCVGIGDIDDESAFMLYPNPADDQTYLLTKGLQGNYHLVLEDMTGMMVREREIYLESIDSQNHIIDLTGLAPGMYLVKVYNSHRLYINKLIIR